MQSLNGGFLVGNMARDAELKYTPSGAALISGCIAINTPVKKPDGTWGSEGHFFDFTYWFSANASTKLVEYLKKGKQVAMSYELRQQHWVDKDTQKNMSKVALVARAIQLVGGEPGARGPKPEEQTPPAWAQSKTGPAPAAGAAPAGYRPGAPAQPAAGEPPTFVSDEFDESAQLF